MTAALLDQDKKRIDVSKDDVKFVQHFNTGYILKDKFFIECLVGKGGFGQIYRAQDVRYGITMAVKVGLRNFEPMRMIMEQRVLLALTGSAHSPALLASGTSGKFMFIAMELLGRNLTDLRKNEKQRHFSVGTTIRIGQQCVEALMAIHHLGFLHRDVKPLNMCIGLGSKRRTIYLVDFGMVRRFRFQDGTLRRKRAYAAFRGTTRYVSLAMHNRCEQCPVDDVWSLLYSMIEFGEGTLPWRLVTDQVAVQKQKAETRIEDMCSNLPKGLCEFAEYLETVGYGEELNYDLLKIRLQNLLPKNVDGNTLFDWESTK